MNDAHRALCGLSAGRCEDAAIGTRLWSDPGPVIFSPGPLPLSHSADLVRRAAGHYQVAGRY
jgi:hypothetical protein